MYRESLRTDAAPRAIGPYSQAIRVGETLFCSGQIGLDPASGELMGGGTEVETRRVMDNLAAVLTSAGLTMADVVKTTVYLTDLGDFSLVNKVYAGYFGDSPPARSTVAVSALPRGAAVEIEAIAVRS